MRDFLEVEDVERGGRVRDEIADAALAPPSAPRRRQPKERADAAGGGDVRARGDESQELAAGQERNAFSHEAAFYAHRSAVWKN